MAESYRGWHLENAFKTQVAVYDRGSFKGHFASLQDARAFVDARITEGDIR